MTAAMNRTNPNKKDGSLYNGFVLLKYFFIPENENAVKRAVKAANDTALTPAPKMAAV